MPGLPDVEAVEKKAARCLQSIGEVDIVHRKQRKMNKNQAPKTSQQQPKGSLVQRTPADVRKQRNDRGRDSWLPAGCLYLIQLPRGALPSSGRALAEFPSLVGDVV